MDMWGKKGTKEGHDSRAVANRFIDHAEGEGEYITILQLVKFVYLAHGWNLGAYHKPLICHDIEAWPYGPLILEVYEAFRPKPPKPPVAPVVRQAKYTADLSETEERVIEKVYNTYSRMPPYKLSELTHKPGTPWHRARQRGFRALLSRKSIEDYYSNLIERRTRRTENGD